MNDPFDRVVAALRDGGCRVRINGPDKIRATCPTHADAKPSLCVTYRDGRVLMHCFAGCRKGDIVRALGLRMSDLFSADATTPPRRSVVVATYDYYDLHGE